ncbi:MAG TPA: AraC family ligand binding domain-containing protein, partial [Daejeonella sp.]|nr:AraC family ligand binding domain-containing protein [Daejeonella sp.]
MKSDIPVYDLHTISEYRQEDILISRLAPYVENHKHLLFPHRHNFFHIVLFTKGSGTHAIDFQSFPVKPYQIYFMSPGQVHDWNFEKRVDGYVINFSNSFFQSFLLRPDFLENFPFFDGSVNNSVLNIPEEYREQIKELFEELLHEETGNKKHSANMVRVLLLKIFILISRFSIQDHKSAINSSYNYTLLKNFQQLIERNYTALRLPKDYAELLYITPNHLNALCNDMLGISAG